MAEATRFTIGVDATCTDGICGTVSRVVVDPVARAVTHLVVEPRHHPRSARLVPLELVEAVTGEVRLRCTLVAFEDLEAAEETFFLPGNIGYAGYGPDQVLSWPYYGLGPSVGGDPPTLTYDMVPLGEISVRRGEPVHATDGDIGRVQGLVISPPDHHVTHVLLQEGHLWGRKDVAIPIALVARVDGGIRVTISKQEVQDLPAVDMLAHGLPSAQD